MDIAFGFTAFLFMVFFLFTYRNIRRNKTDYFLILITSLLFGLLFWEIAFLTLNGS